MEWEKARRRLFERLNREIKGEAVLSAMARVPREEFVPEASRHLAYEDIPLPIGEGQTISQPYIVGLMAHALELHGVEKVLEIGTGSGYQAAILSLLASRVVTVERLPLLCARAKERLASLGFSNVEVYEAEATLGRQTDALYDAIVVAAGAPKLPQSLLEQLAVSGRLVIPIGSRYEQELVKIVKLPDGLSFKTLGPCRFVPLVGEGAWRAEDWSSGEQGPYYY